MLQKHYKIITEIIIDKTVGYVYNTHWATLTEFCV